MTLPRGLYEVLLTRRLREELQRLDPALTPLLAKLDSAEAADRLALHLARVVERVLDRLGAHERVDAGTALVGDLILKAVSDTGVPLEGEVPDPAGEQLRQLAGRHPDGSLARIEEPVVPLLDTALMTNAPGEPRLGAQIVSEIPSADGIDLIMAFIRRSGLAPMRDAVARHLRDGRPMRVLTTVYTASTEASALEALADLGARVRVSYDTSGTRLHAKAWIFHRDNGFSTGYIGSSNLTHSAQVSGLEWNLRVSAARNRTVLERMAAVFETFWNGGDFVDFDAATFRAALGRIREPSRPTPLPAIELRLEPFQERLLERIELERTLGRHRNLLVSATGTGKTVMAAVDYARLRDLLPRARLLFVAHRREILDQSRDTFRFALRDASFGERWVDGDRPAHFEHVFASVQSLARIDLADLAPDHFDVVIVDEFHHAAADTYRRLLDHLAPRELLGLTATPERADGRSVTAWFDHRIAAELRLWDAIDTQRLVPFAYYGVPDDTDLTRIPWKRGRGYDVDALSRVLTADDVWARRVIQALQQRVDDIGQVRALGFCVSVEHAHFMARVFTAHGIASVAVSAESSREEREAALRELKARRLQVVFSVDLFNEGVDVPEVDTLLMLRPTDSPTLFLQQLGRGLRRHHGKALCTVLDFVGRHRSEFSFDRRLRALLGGTRKQLIEQVTQGFPFLPSGCHMALEGVARERVLASLKDAVPRGLTRMADQVRVMRAEGLPVTLASFLDHTGLELDDVYANARGWTDVREAAGEPLAARCADEAELRRACGRLLHVDDGSRIDRYLRWLSLEAPPAPAAMTKGDARALRMLLAALSSAKPLAHVQTGSLEAGAHWLWRHPNVLGELREVLTVLRSRIDHLGFPLTERPDVPLRVHARYSRPEIQAAFGDVKGGDAKGADATTLDPEHATLGVPVWREGVKWIPRERCDVFLVTLTKTEKRFSPTTRYRDYAISRELMHWESQSGTTAASPTGQRYQYHARDGSAVMLFVRQSPDDRAFHFVGPATYVSHQSETPMQVTWRLTHPLPGDLFVEYRAVAG
jgi:superfamily II DNA or RNA helicase/HKD family nuclease